MEQYSPPVTKLGFRSNKRYHVFLSFRGSDVRKTLVDHLFEALSAAGVNVYKDDEKLEKGENIWSSLEEAIKSSAICIPIFSEGYANSAWCLKEAAAMLRNPALIIPLFYHVDPTHVRYPQRKDSPYKDSFAKHYNYPDRHPREEVDEWRDALLRICDRSGWSMDITQGHEARLVKRMVNDLIKTLDRVPLQVAKHPVGLDNLKNTLIQKLNLNLVDKVIKVGIWGIGGIGKTTVAKAVYNQLYGDFEAASFVSDVRATAAETKGLRNLQKKILKDLTKYDEKVDNVDEGISLFIDRLGGKRVLVILDDVDAVAQLDALVGDWLHSGSRVIITSRDQHILNVAQISSECMQEISGLKINEGLQLFSWHAFLRATPNQSHEKMSKRMVEACKGHPLSLEVIGSFLYDKQDNIDCWEEALRNIFRYPQIQERLYISYNALNEEEKEIFLDIACFFIGEEKTRPIIFWKSLYKMVDTALCNLSMKLLIKIDESGVFHMHDLLRDMGRTIAEKEKEHSRLWEGTISHNINFSRLRLDGGSPQRFEMLFKPGLRYLHLKYLMIEGMTTDTLVRLPSSLIWLRMEGCQLDIGNNRAIKKPGHSRFEGSFLELRIMELIECAGMKRLSISSLFSIPNIGLQYLNFTMYSWLSNADIYDSQLWLLQQREEELQQLRLLQQREEELRQLPQLQQRLLRQRLQRQWLQRQWQLQLQWRLQLQRQRQRQRQQRQQRLQLSLQQGHELMELINLPHTIGNLTQLQHLILRGCSNLTSLPETIGNLSQLQHLDLTMCVNLDNLPDSIGNLLQLQHLHLEGCSSLNKLPDTISNLSQLQKLNLIECSSLNNLDIIGNLTQLQYLYLESSNLNNLFDTIDNMSNLQHLYVKNSDRLNKLLPNTFGNLSYLGWGMYKQKTYIENA